MYWNKSLWPKIKVTLSFYTKIFSLVIIINQVIYSVIINVIINMAFQTHRKFHDKRITHKVNVSLLLSVSTQILSVTSNAEYCEQYVAYACRMSRLLNTPGKVFLQAAIIRIII